MEERLDEVTRVIKTILETPFDQELIYRLEAPT
jgi:hypothetical protein